MRSNKMNHKIICGDFYKVLTISTFPSAKNFDCVIADPPDNIDLKYESYKDKVDQRSYEDFMKKMMEKVSAWGNISWISFNAKHTFFMGKIVEELRKVYHFEAMPCVQTFTFGQHNKHDLGNCYRPLWRIKQKSATLYPDNIRIKSWRQKNGDKRANPAGKVPGDVFDFPRVTGNSKQRRSWHPTQLNEDLVERCILLSTKPGDRVLDIFGGTGTTLRVCKRIDRECTLIEIDETYCKKISEEHNIPYTYG